MSQKNMKMVMIVAIIFGIAGFGYGYKANNDAQHPARSDASELASASCTSQGTVQFKGMTQKWNYCTVSGLDGKGITMFQTLDGKLAGGMKNTSLQVSAQDLLSRQGDIIFPKLTNVKTPGGDYELHEAVIIANPDPRRSPTASECESYGGTMIGGDCFIVYRDGTVVWGSDGSWIGYPSSPTS